jgi:hypothetical protein
MSLFDSQCHTAGQAERDLADTAQRIAQHLAADPAARFRLHIVLDLHEPPPDLDHDNRPHQS